jgi:uncharacterized protein
LVFNASELLRQPGTVRPVSMRVALADVDVVDDRVAGDIIVDLTLTSSLDDIEVAGTLDVTWSDQCRRCLTSLAETLTIPVEERYAPAPVATSAAVDPEAFPIEHGQLDLAPMVREGVLLGIPDAPLCRPDCAGICPTCGADLNAGPCDCAPTVRDERWSVLDQLRGDPDI